MHAWRDAQHADLLTLRVAKLLPPTIVLPTRTVDLVAFVDRVTGALERIATAIEQRPHDAR
jgi:hypothetical protein